MDLLAVTLEETQPYNGMVAIKLEDGGVRCLERVGRLREVEPAHCLVKLRSQSARLQLSADIVHIMTQLLAVAAHWLADSTRPAWELVCR